MNVPLQSTMSPKSPGTGGLVPKLASYGSDGTWWGFWIVFELTRDSGLFSPFCFRLTMWSHCHGSKQQTNFPKLPVQINPSTSYIFFVLWIHYSNGKLATMMTVAHSGSQQGSVQIRRGTAHWHPWFYLYPFNHTAEHREISKTFLWVSGRDGCKGFYSLSLKLWWWLSITHFNFPSKSKAFFPNYLLFMRTMGDSSCCLSWLKNVPLAI